MKYAWYIDDNNTGIDFCCIENKPMELDDALSLTCDTESEYYAIQDFCKANI